MPLVKIIVNVRMQAQPVNDGAGLRGFVVDQTGFGGDQQNFVPRKLCAEIQVLAWGSAFASLIEPKTGHGGCSEAHQAAPKLVNTDGL